MHPPLRLLSALLLGACLTSALPANQTDTITSLGSLEANLTSSISSLGADPGIVCTLDSRGGPRHTPIFLDSCLGALNAALHPRTPLPAARVFLPSFWAKPESGFPGEKFSLPVSWSDPAVVRGCRIVVNAEGEGRTAIGQFSLVGVLNYASLVLDQCVQGQKVAYGGRFTLTRIAKGGFYVDVTGDKPLGVDGAGGWVEGNATKTVELQ